VTDLLYLFRILKHASSIPSDALALRQGLGALLWFVTAILLRLQLLHQNQDLLILKKKNIYIYIYNSTKKKKRKGSATRYNTDDMIKDSFCVAALLRFLHLKQTRSIIMLQRKAKSTKG